MFDVFGPKRILCALAWTDPSGLRTTTVRRDFFFQDVSQEDLIKRERRRERNKVAAAKCRFKKKIVSERLQEVREIR